MLWCHVGRCAEDVAVNRDRDFTGFALGETKVHDVRLAVVVNHDVGRFHIAVDDACFVRVVQGVGNLGAHCGGVAHSDGPGSQAAGERNALHVVADDIDVVVFASDFMDAHDPRMAQLGGGAGFPQESLSLCRLQLSPAWDLDRDRAVHFCVVRLPDRAEGPDADSLQQLKMADGLVRPVRVADGLVVDKAEATAAR